VNLRDLHDIVEDWFNESGLNHQIVFPLNMEEGGQSALEKLDQHETRISFHITLDQDSDSDILFSILYAQSIELSIEDDPQTISYNDFDYSDFIDYCSDALSAIDTSATFEFDHIGGDVDSNTEYIDFYFTINYLEE